MPDFWRVHWCRLSRLQDLPDVWLWSSGRVFPPFVRSFALRLVRFPEYGSISRFKGVFSAVCGRCVGLCGLRALRGLCGFCARVELGGLEA